MKYFSAMAVKHHSKYPGLWIFTTSLFYKKPLLKLTPYYFLFGKIQIDEDKKLNCCIQSKETLSEFAYKYSNKFLAALPWF